MNDDSRTLSDIEARGRIKPSKLSHVVLRTLDLPPMRDWYLKVLNADVTFEQKAQVCFMSFDQEHHRLGIVRIPSERGVGAPSTGLEHMSFTYATLGELLANYQRLKADGINPYWPIIHGPTVSLYYKDPDGNRVELQYDVFDTAEGANAFIAANYQENFMGIIFEPEEMIRRYEAGVPLAELTARAPLALGQTPWDMHRA